MRRSIFVQAVWLFALLLAPVTPVAATQLAIDHVHVGAGREHTLVLRATDDEGRPVEGLEHAFDVSLDGGGVGGIKVRSPFEAALRRTLVVVVDGEMLQPSNDARAFVEDLLGAAAGQLAPADRVIVLSAGATTKQREWRAADLKTSPAEARALAQDGAPRLFDTLVDGAKLAAAARTLSSGLLLVVTRGADQGSRRHVADVLATAADAAGVTSVVVALVEDGGSPTAVDRLDRLAGVTHGSLRRVNMPAGAAPQDIAVSAVALLRRYQVSFKPLEFDGSEDRHQVEVKLAGDGPAVTAAQSYRLSDASERPWWSSLWVWVILVLTLGVGIAIVLLMRPRPIGLLVMVGGEDDGTWFEVFALPLTVGAAKQNDILIAAEGVSRNHCVLEREGRNIVLVDTNSEKGTFVNDERVRRRELEDDDHIRLGPDVELVFEARR